MWRALKQQTRGSRNPESSISDQAVGVPSGSWLKTGLLWDENLAALCLSLIRNVFQSVGLAQPILRSKRPCTDSLRGYVDSPSYFYDLTFAMQSATRGSFRIMKCSWRGSAE